MQLQLISSFFRKAFGSRLALAGFAVAAIGVGGSVAYVKHLQAAVTKAEEAIAISHQQVDSLHLLLDQTLTAAEQMQTNYQTGQRLATEALERERLKEPLVNEVIRYVYQDREVPVPQECVAVLVPLDRALDGVRKLRAATRAAASASF